MKRAALISTFCLIFTVTMNAPALGAQDAGRPAPMFAEAAQAGSAASIRLDTPSGLPVPRFVSLKSDKTFCRAGPSFAHPVRITFMRRGLPLMVVAETKDHWRKVRDLEGDECWTHRSKLSGAETALVVQDGLALRARPDAAAPARARLGRGLITQVETARNGWLRVSADGVRGWAPQSGFWGATSANAFAAAHN